jgi:hypothetical protein
LDESEPKGGSDGPKRAFLSNSNSSEASKAASKLPISEASPPLCAPAKPGDGENADEDEQPERGDEQPRARQRLG